MQALVIAEHDNQSLNAATRTAVSAAQALVAAGGGGQISLLVAGEGCSAVAQAASALAGVTEVIQSEGPALKEGLAEDLVDHILAQVRAQSYQAIVFPATTSGKNLAPRLAALLDVAAISDVTRVVDAKTFERPIYAGNVIATVESSDPVLVFTARTTAFAPVPDGSTAAPIRAVAAPPASSRSAFVGQSLSKSDRPELASAKVVVSGRWRSVTGYRPTCWTVPKICSRIGSQGSHGWGSPRVPRPPRRWCRGLSRPSRPWGLLRYAGCPAQRNIFDSRCPRASTPKNPGRGPS